MTTSSNLQSSIEALLNPTGNGSRPTFRNDSSLAAEHAMRFEKQLSAARDRSGSDRALDRQNASERAAQDAARRRSSDRQDLLDAAAADKAADKAADRTAARRAAEGRAALAETRAEAAARLTGEAGPQIEPGANERYHTASDRSTDPVGAQTRIEASAEMSALAQVLAAEASAAQRIAQVRAGGDAQVEVPAVTSVEATSGPDGVRARLSIELALDASAKSATGAAGDTGLGLNAATNLAASLGGEQNNLLTALLGLDVSADAATGVQGMTGTQDLNAQAPKAGEQAPQLGQPGRPGQAMEPGQQPALPEGVQVTSQTNGAAGTAGPAGAATNGIAADLAGAAAAGISQPTAAASAAEAAAAAATSAQTSAQTNAQSGAEAATNAAATAPVPDRIMVNGQWMSGAEASAAKGTPGTDGPESVGATTGTPGLPGTTGAAGTMTDDAEADAQSDTTFGAAATDGPESSQSTDGNENSGFSLQVGQNTQTSQLNQANAVTGSGFSTAAGQSVAEQVSQQLAAQLRTLREGSHRAVIHLSPDDLGDVTVTLSVHNGDVRLDLVAAPAALSQLQSGLSDLREQMQQSGLNLADVSMSQSADTGASANSNGGQGSHQPPASSNGTLPGASSLTTGTTGNAVTPSATPMSGAANGALDVMI